MQHASLRLRRLAQTGRHAAPHGSTALTALPRGLAWLLLCCGAFAGVPPRSGWRIAGGWGHHMV
eukprot:scaffold18291_cov121-Isochrysis_galbana.AAC.1